MYEKILVAIDQSPVVGQVLAAARDLARLSNGEKSAWGVSTRMAASGAGRSRCQVRKCSHGR